MKKSSGGHDNDVTDLYTQVRTEALRNKDSNNELTLIQMLNAFDSVVAHKTRGVSPEAKNNDL